VVLNRGTIREVDHLITVEAIRARAFPVVHMSQHIVVACIRGGYSALFTAVEIFSTDSPRVAR
jgi:hypothetical protein